MGKLPELPRLPKIAEIENRRKATIAPRSADLPLGRSAALRDGLRREEKCFFDPLRGPKGPLFHRAEPTTLHLASNKKRGRLFLRPLNASRNYKSNKPFYWQTDEDPPTKESQNLAMGAPPAEPVAGIVIVCSVKTPLVTVAPFGTVSEG